MNCKSCNTRLPGGAKACPHCGHSQRGSSFIDRVGRKPTGNKKKAASGSSLSPSSHGLGSSASGAGFELEDEVELPLEAAVGKSAKKSASKPAKKRTQTTQKRGSVAVAAPDVRFQMSPAEMIQLVSDQPELLEPGLSAFTDDAGLEVGVGYATDVGRIDLLARSDDGALVVVMVVEEDAETDTIPEMLHRVGWVRKHLLKGDQTVRGIVVLEQVDESLEYAAAAVGDTIEFRTCRVAVAFDRVEL